MNLYEDGCKYDNFVDRKVIISTRSIVLVLIVSVRGIVGSQDFI